MGLRGPDGFRSITAGPTPTPIYATDLIGLPSMIGALYTMSLSDLQDCKWIDLYKIGRLLRIQE